MTLTQADLHAMFDYEESGHLRWKYNPKKPRNWNTKNAGKLAGSIRPDGRRVINYQGKVYYVSRLIYLFHKGVLPEEVDHEDRNVMNDRIENLLPSTRALNSGNRRAKGYQRHGNRYHARIFIDGKLKSLGVFDTAWEATQAYEQAQTERLDKGYGK